MPASPATRRADGLARLEWSVPADADIVIVELGANDALRGIDPEATREALAKILATLKARGQTVLLAGMLAPRNLGDGYAREFDAHLSGARRANTASTLYPFFLAGVATDPTLNQADGMHPNAAGVAEIVERDVAGCREAGDAAAGRLTLTNRRARRRR